MLLVILVAAGLAMNIGIAVLFFFFTTPASVAFGAGMLIVSAGAALVTLRAVRPKRYRAQRAPAGES